MDFINKNVYTYFGVKISVSKARLKLLISLFSLSKFQMRIRIGSVPWEWCQATRFCSVAAEGEFWNSGTWIILCQLERWRVMIVLSMLSVLIPPTFLLQLSKFSYVIFLYIGCLHSGLINISCEYLEILKYEIFLVL